MAFMAVILGLGLLFYILLGFRLFLPLNPKPRKSIVGVQGLRGVVRVFSVTLVEVQGLKILKRSP